MPNPSARPAIALTGPRQCGKTTLVELHGKDYVARDPYASVTHFHLERATDRRRLQTPEQALSPLSGLVVIDEV